MEFNDAFFRDLGTSAPVTQLCLEVGERVASAARASGRTKSGAYVGGIVIRIKHNARLVNVVQVVATDPKSMILESKYGTLARALGAAKT